MRNMPFDMSKLQYWECQQCQRMTVRKECICQECDDYNQTKKSITQKKDLTNRT